MSLSSSCSLNWSDSLFSPTLLALSHRSLFRRMRLNWSMTRNLRLSSFLTKLVMGWTPRGCLKSTTSHVSSSWTQSISMEQGMWSTWMDSMRFWNQDRRSGSCILCCSKCTSVSSTSSLMSVCHLWVMIGLWGMCLVIWNVRCIHRMS